MARRLLVAALAAALTLVTLMTAAAGTPCRGGTSPSRHRYAHRPD